MKEINLREILKEYLDCDRSITSIEYAMRESCNQAIELCAQEAKILRIDTHDTDPDEYEIDKESIIKVKEAIK